jgi:hypothetical protein
MLKLITEKLSRPCGLPCAAIGPEYRDRVQSPNGAHYPGAAGF